MRTEIEYKPDGMARVHLMFRRAGRDPEDLWIRSELERFPIPPKRILEREHDGEVYDDLQYGQCVIGEYMYDIEKHQQLCQRIGELCTEEVAASPLSETDREGLISELAREFHGEAKMTWDEDDNFLLVVEDAPLRERALELLAATTA